MDVSWKDALSPALSSARKIAVLGVGNTAKGDDGAGAVCAGRLKRRIPPDSGRIVVIDGGEVPEHHTGEIRRFGPDLTLILDAAVAGRAPGTISVIERDAIAEDGISTHRISLRYLIRYLEETIGGAVCVLGIEPETIALTLRRTDLSAAVEKAVQEIADFILTKIRPGPDG